MKKKSSLYLFPIAFILLAMNMAGKILQEEYPSRIKATVGIRENDQKEQKVTGLNTKKLSRISSIVKEGLKAKAYPGCQVLILKDGITVYDNCFGNQTYDQSRKVTPNTLYDLASLSKTTGTLLAVMKLYDDGKIQLTDKASSYLSALKGTDKENITLSDLLFHESGLPASLSCDRILRSTDTSESIQIGRSWYKKSLVSKVPTAEYSIQIRDSFYVHDSFHFAALQVASNLHVRTKTYLYSCVNFILLKELVETISDKPMDRFLDSLFYKPMALTSTTYRPLTTHAKNEIAPTLKSDYLYKGMLQGYVHDPDAAFLGGVSGNAGLFSTARDVAKVYQMLLNHGELNGKRYLSTKTCELFTGGVSNSGRRGLGFDKPNPANRDQGACCPSAPLEVYGHTGYTGTCCWVDPVNKLVYVFLSNRTYPNDGVNKLARMNIRTRIQEVIYQSLSKK